jgi:hypothetical protein
MLQRSVVSRLASAFCLAAAVFAAPAASAVTIDLVTVGAPGNAADTNSVNCAPVNTSPCGAFDYVALPRFREDRSYTVRGRFYVEVGIELELLNQRSNESAISVRGEGADRRAGTSQAICKPLAERPSPRPSMRCPRSAYPSSQRFGAAPSN